MYFLSEEEKRLVYHKLLPEARRQEVAEELRGWRWHQAPLSPIYDIPLGVHEVAGRYCPTGRDTYLRRVHGLRRPPNAAMVAGQALHRLLCDLIVAAKRAIYLHGRDCVGQLRALPLPPPAELDVQALEDDERAGLEQDREALWRFEVTRIVGRTEEAIARQPYAGPDSLVALALPVVVEQRLDGRFLGLSPHLAVDAFTFAQPMIMDVKFGRPEPFHRWGTTGYALVMESLHEFPVDLGCTVYVRFEGDQVRLERDFYVIGDELRQRFIEERDELARLVEEEIDPGLPDECPPACPYLRDCRPA